MMLLKAAENRVHLSYRPSETSETTDSNVFIATFSSTDDFGKRLAQNTHLFG